MSLFKFFSQPVAILIESSVTESICRSLVDVVVCDRGLNKNRNNYCKI